MLSPTLLLVVMDGLNKEAGEQVKNVIVGYRGMAMVEITGCTFADDLAVFARNKKDLQYNFEVWCKALEARDLRLNEDKMKMVVISKEDTKIAVHKR